MSPVDVRGLADEVEQAYAARRPLDPPSARPAGLSLAEAYAVESELARRKRARGARPVGRKVGYANKAMWRVLKLDTLVWAHVYSDTVHDARDGSRALAVEHLYSPKIEPEIVFKLSAPLGPDAAEPDAALRGVEWLALGFEIIDCVFPDWSYQPADFVASYGLHAALVVGEPLRVEPSMISGLADDLARFSVKLSKNGVLVEEGAGRNALRSPARSLGELAAALARQPGAEPLAAGELVSSGTLTTSTPMAPGDSWHAAVEGLAVASLTLRT
jgi:2-oxo-3-hexenedioate decarboxylase